MGAGKTSIGRLLAEKLNIPFFDQDELIETASGSSVATLFKDNGEDWFRRYEADFLRSFDYPADFVFSTGGGCPCFFENMNWINLKGKSIYLAAEAAVLTERLRSVKDNRPLISNLLTDDFGKQIAERLASREVYYRSAHLLIKMKASDTTEIVFASVLKELGLS